MWTISTSFYSQKRDTTNYVVSILISVFEKCSKFWEHEQITGYAIGTGTPLVVALIGSIQNYVHAHFISGGLSEDDNARKVQEQSVWYGAVDDNHSNKAFCHPITENCEWENESCFVTDLKWGSQVERYCQRSHFQNNKQSANYYVSLTMFEKHKKSTTWT